MSDLGTTTSTIDEERPEVAAAARQRSRRGITLEVVGLYVICIASALALAAVLVAVTGGSWTAVFSAILDGQLTTAAGGWVLLQYGSGPIKGFATLLLVGVFTTITTNIWVTRIFFDWYIARKKGQLATISI